MRVGGRDRLGDRGALVPLVERLGGREREVHLVEPASRRAGRSLARSARDPRRRRPARRSSAATTSSAPAICGTRAGLTKLTASMRGRPAAASRSTSSARTAGSSDAVVLQAVARPDVADRDRASKRRPPPAARELVVGEPEQPAVDLVVVAALSQVADHRTAPGVSESASARCPARCTGRTRGRRAREASRAPGTAGPRRCPRSCRSGRRSTPASLRTRSISAASRSRAHVGDDALDLVLVVAAREMGGESLVVCELRPPDRPQRRRNTPSAFAAITIHLSSRERRCSTARSP